MDILTLLALAIRLLAPLLQLSAQRTPALADRPARMLMQTPATAFAGADHCGGFPKRLFCRFGSPERFS